MRRQQCRLALHCTQFFPSTSLPKPAPGQELGGPPALHRLHRMLQTLSTNESSSHPPMSSRMQSPRIPFSASPPRHRPRCQHARAPLFRLRRAARCMCRVSCAASAAFTRPAHAPPIAPPPCSLLLCSAYLCHHEPVALHKHTPCRRLPAISWHSGQDCHSAQHVPTPVAATLHSRQQPPGRG